MSLQIASRGFLAPETRRDSLTAMLTLIKVLQVPGYPSPYGLPCLTDDYRLLREMAADRSFRPLTYSSADIDYLMNRIAGVGGPLTMKDFDSQSSYGIEFGTEGGIGSAHQVLEGLWRYVRERGKLPRADCKIGWRLRTSTPVGDRRIEIFWSVTEFRSDGNGLGLRLVADKERDQRLGAWPI